MNEQMPRYKCHKIVGALKIGKILAHDDGTATIQTEEEGFGHFQVSAGFIKKHKPVAGGYYVEYEDGYVSFSPAEAFEKGYRRCPNMVDASGDVRTLEIGPRKYTEVKVLDGPGPGNANHEYEVVLVENRNVVLCGVSFQNGPIKEAGVNGVANEDLIAIVIDRLEGFQSGEYACDLNEIAKSHLGSCLKSLRSRTDDREERGVEGTNVV